MTDAFSDRGMHNVPVSAERANKGKPKLSYVLQFDVAAWVKCHESVTGLHLGAGEAAKRILEHLHSAMLRETYGVKCLYKAASYALHISTLRASTGGPTPPSLVIPSLLALDMSGLASDCAFGAHKYSRFGNFRKPFYATEVLDSAMRHLQAMHTGEEWVPDAKEAGFDVRHSDAIAWNCLQLAKQLSEGYAGPEFDDRPKDPSDAE